MPTVFVYGLIAADPSAYIPTLQEFEGVFASGIQSLLALAGILVFITFIIGGFKYITAGGDPKAIQAAHSTLTYAILGLILVVLSFSIILLIQYFTGNTNILKFVVVQ